MINNTTMVHVKVRKKVKSDAQQVARKLGISLSLVAEQAFRDFAVGKRLVIEEPLVPSKKLEKILKEVDHDLRRGTKGAFSPVFTSAKAMNEYLDQYVASYK